MTLNKLGRLKRTAFRRAFVRAHIASGIAHQIRALRTQRGLSQAALAKELGLKNQSAVARLEDPSYGRHSIATLLKLSDAFDVPLLVKFVPYSRFLHEIADVSPRAISAESFDVELPKLEEALEARQTYTSVTPSSAERRYDKIFVDTSSHYPRTTVLRAGT